MNKQVHRIAIVLVLSMGFFFAQATSINAADSTPTPSPADPVVATQTPGAAAKDPNVVTLEMLKISEIHLIGPYDSTGFSFSIPADWKLLEGAQFEISMGVSYNIVAHSPENPVDDGGGTLTILVNNRAVGVVQLNSLGENKVIVPVTLDRLIPTEPNQNITVSFNLNSGVNCNIDQNTDLFIHTNSRFILPHDSIKPDTNLVNFPRPIYQNYYLSDSALLVVSDAPEAAEMKAAMIVSAGLSNISGNNLQLDLTTISRLTAEQIKTNHLILVGNTQLISAFNQISLPLPVTNNQFQIAQGNPDDGVIEMINSPWSNSHVILVVSGNSANGIVKAAQAISTGIIQPNRLSNLAIIDKVQPHVSTALPSADQTLADLGYENILIQRRGLNYTQIAFIVPPGNTLSSDAYFDLIYGNSALIDYNRSGIVVQMNGRPIGSVRFSEATAHEATNTARISIPVTAIVSGRNVIQVITSLVPVDSCSPPNANQGLWVDLWPESLLHLPLTPVTVNATTTTRNLSTYLSSFLYDSTLKDTALVVPENSVEDWRQAVKIAAFIGEQANGPLTDISFFWSAKVPSAERPKYNFILVGRPSESPFLNEMNNDLPVPFLANSDIPAVSTSRIVYRILPDTPLGYIELMPSSWNPNHLVLAILGNSAQGVIWATKALVDSTLNWHLAGNFAIINDRQILINDTSVMVLGTGEMTTAVPDEVIPTTIGNTYTPLVTPDNQPVWILPALGITILLILLIMTLVIVRGWLRNRTRHKSVKVE